MLSRAEEVSIIISSLEAKEDRMIDRLSNIRTVCSNDGIDYKTHPLFIMIKTDLDNLRKKTENYRQSLKLICVTQKF